MSLNNWFLANNGIITAWVPKAQHCSKAHEPLKHCHTAGRTSSFMKPGDMAMPGDTAKQLSIEYEYTIPLSGMKKISDDVWCGFYQQVYVEFAFANHKQAQVLGINQFMNIGKQLTRLSRGWLCLNIKKPPNIVSITFASRRAWCSAISAANSWRTSKNKNRERRCQRAWANYNL